MQRVKSAFEVLSESITEQILTPVPDDSVIQGALMNLWVRNPSILTFYSLSIQSDYQMKTSRIDRAQKMFEQVSPPNQYTYAILSNTVPKNSSVGVSMNSNVFIHPSLQHTVSSFVSLLPERERTLPHGFRYLQWQFFRGAH